MKMSVAEQPIGLADRWDRVEEESAGLFEPYSILPSQYFHQPPPHGELAGERRMIFAILEDGVGCFRRYATATTPRGRCQFIEAAQWIFEEDSGWTFSFESICALFGLDANAVRRSLWQWRDQQKLGRAAITGLPLRRARSGASSRHRISSPPDGCAAVLVRRAPREKT